MRVNSAALVAIVGMAIATYISRAGGLWLLGLVSITPRLERWFQHLPGAVLVAIVAPAVITSDLSEAVAATCTLAVAAYTRNLFMAIVTGVGIASALRIFVFR